MISNFRIQQPFFLAMTGFAFAGIYSLMVTVITSSRIFFMSQMGEYNLALWGVKDVSFRWGYRKG